MKKIFLILLAFGSFEAFAEDDKTVVCVLDGDSDEYYNGVNSSRDVKLSVIVKYNPSGVTNFQNRFLSDYDFIQGRIISDAQKKSNLSVTTEINEDEININLALKEAWVKDKSWNLTPGWLNYQLLLNRKTGIGKVDASLAYKIDSDNYRVSYVVVGDCNIAKNKF